MVSGRSQKQMSVPTTGLPAITTPSRGGSRRSSDVNTSVISSSSTVSGSSLNTLLTSASLHHSSLSNNPSTSSSSSHTSILPDHIHNHNHIQNILHTLSTNTNSTHPGNEDLFNRISSLVQQQQQSVILYNIGLELMDQRNFGGIVTYTLQGIHSLFNHQLPSNAIIQLYLLSPTSATLLNATTSAGLRTFEKAATEDAASTTLDADIHDTSPVTPHGHPKEHHGNDAHASEGEKRKAMSHILRGRSIQVSLSLESPHQNTTSSSSTATNTSTATNANSGNSGSSSSSTVPPVNGTGTTILSSINGNKESINTSSPVPAKGATNNDANTSVGTRNGLPSTPSASSMVAANGSLSRPMTPSTINFDVSTNYNIVRPSSGRLPPLATTPAPLASPQRISVHHDTSDTKSVDSNNVINPLIQEAFHSAAVAVVMHNKPIVINKGHIQAVHSNVPSTMVIEPLFISTGQNLANSLKSLANTNTAVPSLIGIPIQASRRGQDSIPLGAITIMLPLGTIPVAPMNTLSSINENNSHTGHTRGFNQSDVDSLFSLGTLVARTIDHTQKINAALGAHRRTMGIVKMLKAVSHEVEVPAVIANVVNVAYDLLQADRVSVFLIDQEKKELVLAVSEDAAGLRLPMDKGIVGAAATTGKTLNIPDAYDSPLFDRSFDIKTGYRTKSVLCMPIYSPDGQAVAVIQAINKKDGERFTSEDIGTLSTVADTAGVTLHKAKLLQEANTAKAANAALVEVVRLVNESENEDVETLTASLVDIAYRLIDADRITLYVVDELKNELFCLVSHDGDQSTLVRIPIGTGLVGECAATGKVINIRDAHKDARFDSSTDTSTGYRTRSVLCMPVTLSNPGSNKPRVVAVIQAVNKHRADRFSEVDEELLSAFSSEVGVVIDRRSLEFAFGKAVADETEGTGTGGGKISSLLGEYVKQEVLVSANTARTQNVRRVSESSGPLAPAALSLEDTNTVSRATADTLETVEEEDNAAKPTPTADAAKENGTASGTTESSGIASTSTEGTTTTPTPDTTHTDVTKWHKQKAPSIASNIASPTPSVPAPSSPTLNSVAAPTALAASPLLSGGDSHIIPWSPVPSLPGRQDVFTRIRSWDYNVLDYDDDELCLTVLDMIQTFNLIDTFHLNTDLLSTFVTGVRGKYRKNPYHNFRHGVSVAHVCFLGAYSTKAAYTYLQPLDILSLLLCALCHDVDHPGVNNAYETNAITDLAVIYNDQSVLENHHAAVMFELLRAGEKNIVKGSNTSGKNRSSVPVTGSAGTSTPNPLALNTSTAEDTVSILGLSRKDFLAFRKLAISGILATDMTHHNALTDTIRRRNPTDEIPAKLLVEMFVHSGDLSNPVLPNFDAVRTWADLVCTEFTEQVNKEKAEGLPFAPHMDGLTTLLTKAKLQLGFIDYVVAPLWNSIVNIIPEMKCAADCMVVNRNKWKAIIDNETAAATVVATATTAAASTT